MTTQTHPTLPIGTTFTLDGVTFRVHAFSGTEYELWPNVPWGVCFATPEQLRAVGVL